MKNSLKPSLSMTQRWVMAARPRTLPAALAPVLAGGAIAWRGSPAFRWDALAAAALCALLLQIIANMVNDVIDFYKGTDAGERLGPVRVTQAGLLTPRQMWVGIGVCVAITLMAGLYLIWAGGWVVLVIGVICLAAAFAYTAPPFSLAERGLGDLFVFICFGLLGVTGTAYVTGGVVTPSAWLAAIGVGFLTVNILVVNNVRDLESDRRVGRRTIAVVFGRRVSEWQYLAMIIGSYALLPLLWLVGAPWSVGLVALSVPGAARLYRTLCTLPGGPAFNRLLAATAQHLLVYSVLLAVGFLLPW